MKHVAKAVIAGATTLGTWGGTALADGSVSAVELFGLTGVLVAIAGVYATPNKES